MGMTTIAGPGNTIIAIPTRVTVPPTTAATTRLAVRYLRVSPLVFNAFMAVTVRLHGARSLRLGNAGSLGRHAERKRARRLAPNPLNSCVWNKLVTLLEINLSHFHGTNITLKPGVRAIAALISLRSTWSTTPLLSMSAASRNPG